MLNNYRRPFLSERKNCRKKIVAFVYMVEKNELFVLKLQCMNSFILRL